MHLLQKEKQFKIKQGDWFFGFWSVCKCLCVTLFLFQLQDFRVFSMLVSMVTHKEGGGFWCPSRRSWLWDASWCSTLQDLCGALSEEGCSANLFTRACVLCFGSVFVE